MLTVHYLTEGDVSYLKICRPVRFSSFEFYWIQTSKLFIIWILQIFEVECLSFILEEWNIPVSILRVGLLLSLY